MSARKARTWPMAAALVVAVSTNLVGCKSRNESAAPESSSKAPADSSLSAMLSEYEAIRALLARDATAGIADASERLADQATRSASRVPQTSGTLNSITQNARSLKEASGRGLPEARRSFGELSRGVIELLAKDPTLRAGRWVFECPMADGYKKWVQTTDSIANPYMGKSMPSCGEASTFAP